MVSACRSGEVFLMNKWNVTTQKPSILVPRIPIVKTTLGTDTNGLHYSIKKSSKEQTYFLSQLGLVDLETARERIQKSRDIKLYYKDRTQELVKKMLQRKKKLYCIENGILKRVKPVSSVTKSKWEKSKRRRIRKRSKSPSVYYPNRKRNESKTENGSGTKASLLDRTHLLRKSVVGLGLNSRSKELLKACCPVTVNVLKMTNEEITNKILELKYCGSRKQLVVPLTRVDADKSFKSLLTKSKKTSVENSTPRDYRQMSNFLAAPQLILKRISSELKTQE